MHEISPLPIAFSAGSQVVKAGFTYAFHIFSKLVNTVLSFPQRCDFFLCDYFLTETNNRAFLFQLALHTSFKDCRSGKTVCGKCFQKQRGN